MKNVKCTKENSNVFKHTIQFTDTMCCYKHHNVTSLCDDLLHCHHHFGNNFDCDENKEKYAKCVQDNMHGKRSVYTVAT